MKLSDAEITALELIQAAGGSMLVSNIPDKSGRGVFGVEPGTGVYKKLEKKGLVFFTEEEPMEVNGEMFEFTPSVYITEAGQIALKEFS